MAGHQPEAIPAWPAVAVLDAAWAIIRDDAIEQDRLAAVWGGEDEEPRAVRDLDALMRPPVTDRRDFTEDDTETNVVDLVQWVELANRNLE